MPTSWSVGIPPGVAIRLEIVIPIRTEMPLESYWCEQMTYHCDFTLGQGSRLAEYSLEGTAGLTYCFGALPSLATHNDDASVVRREREGDHERLWKPGTHPRGYRRSRDSAIHPPAPSSEHF